MGETLGHCATSRVSKSSRSFFLSECNHLSAFRWRLHGLGYFGRSLADPAVLSKADHIVAESNKRGPLKHSSKPCCIQMTVGKLCCPAEHTGSVCAACVFHAIAIHFTSIYHVTWLISPPAPGCQKCTLNSAALIGSMHEGSCFCRNPP